MTNIIYNGYMSFMAWWLSGQQLEKQVELSKTSDKNVLNFKSDRYEGKAYKIDNYIAITLRYFLALYLAYEFFPQLNNEFRASFVLFISLILALAFQKELSSQTKVIQPLLLMLSVLVLIMAFGLQAMKYGITFEVYSDTAKIIVFSMPTFISLYIFFRVYFDIRAEVFKHLYRIPEQRIIFSTPVKKLMDVKSNLKLIIFTILLIVVLTLLK